MRTLVFLLLFLIPLHMWISSQTEVSKSTLEQQHMVDSTTPGKLLRLKSLEFKEIVADNQLLESIFYVGTLLESNKTTEANWDYFTSLIDSSLELDPFFYDTYYFGSTTLAWNANNYTDAIRILEKGIEYRPYEHLLFFNLGFLYYYFLDDKATAAEYIQRAAQLKDAPAFYASLSSRLAYDIGSHDAAINFLIYMIENTQNESIKAMYTKRLNAILGAVELERIVETYKLESGNTVDDLAELVSLNLIKHIPEDPYGGQYYINEKGRVYSTSKFLDNKKAAD